MTSVVDVAVDVTNVVFIAMSKRGMFSGHPPLPVSKHFGKLNNVGKVMESEEPSTSSLEDTRAFFHGEDDYSMSLTCRMIDIAPSLRRSMPSVAQGRHLSSAGQSVDSDNFSIQSRETSSLPTQSRVTSAASSSSRSQSTVTRNPSNVDVEQIQMYLKKRDSRSSIASSIVNVRPISSDTFRRKGRKASSNSQCSNERKISISSIDSSKEDKIMANIERNCASPVILAAPKREPSMHSADDITSQDSISILNGTLSHSHSTSDLNKTPKESESSTRAASLSRPKSHYIGEIVWQVDEFVYCGGIEAVMNLNLLCRLNIEYIVDLSGGEENLGPRSECPCLCSRRTAHSRMTMTIKIKDDSEFGPRLERGNSIDEETQTREDIIAYFEDIINLIRRARISNKCVLIHSFKGRNRAPAFVAAYLMHSQRCTRVQAINMVTELMSKMRPGICISDNLQRALMRWQSILGIRSSENHMNSPNNTKMFAIRRNAWS